MSAPAWILAALVAAASSAAAPAGDPPRGLVERIVCADDPAHSYALYVPAAHAAGRPSPVLYLLDARGRALLPIERFRAAADELGWILVSSYDSRSDTAEDPNAPALTAMWKDTHARLAIDPRRTYVGGFSGCGRAAVGMALRSPERIAGVIGAGAGFPDESTPVARLPFAYFGTIGDRDFNYLEMRRLESRLSAAQAPFRIATFPGGHDWPGPDVAREALSWMEVQAMRSGARAADAGAPAAGELYRSDLAAAEALASSGRRPEAARRLAAIARDFRGLTDTSEASARAAAMESDPAVQKELREERRRDARDMEAQGSMAEKLVRALSAEELPPPRRIANELGIPALRRKAQSADSPEERLSAERLLASLRVQTSYYLPRRYLDAKDYPRALLVLAVAGEVAPDDPSVAYNRAAAHARQGDASKALRDLQAAVDLGFRRLDALESDDDFAALRGDPAYRRWLEEARRRVSSSSNPSPSPSPSPAPMPTPSSAS